jgi:geranylgeranyl diphosphate synthase type II
MDMDLEKVNMVSNEEYLRMIELKTAVLLAASAKIGSIIGDAPEKDSDHMYEFGLNLGLAFQIQDDLLDVYGDSGIFGKVAGGDIVSNKKTFLLVKALEIATGLQHKKLLKEIQKKEADPEQKIKTVMEIFDSLNIKSITEEIANEYITKSLDHLEKAETACERKRELTLLASSLMGRSK